MSLLLDARKKSQQAQAGQDNPSGLELSLEPHPNPASGPEATLPADSASDDKARITGKNLFNAKSGSVAFARPGSNRNLMIALGGAVVLLAAGAGYVWYAISPGNTQPSRAVNVAAMSMQKPAAAPVPPQNNLVPGIVSAEAAATKPASKTKPKHATRRLARAALPTTHTNDTVHIERRMEEPIDPLLNNAYLAYRDGKFEQSQQLYLKALSLDSNNTDALLGLGVIAQRFEIQLL
jgi:hypothetical protein